MGYGGGVAGLFMHETEDERKARKAAALTSLDGGAQLVPSAMSVLGALGTENGTWFVFGGHRHSWKNDAIRYEGGAGFGVVNLDLFKQISLGPLDPIEFGFGTTTKAGAILQKVQFRVADTPLMLGVKQVAAISTIESDNKVVDWFMDALLGEQAVTSGLGLVVDYDTRDNIFYPTRGYRIEADYMVYDEAIGSDYNYRNLNLDGQAFIPLANKWTLGLAGNYQNFEQGDGFVSPTSKPYVDIRGVSAFRYQGDEIGSVQAQITYDIDHRWKVSGFYGAGRAIESDDIHKDIGAGGVGFRYQIARRYGLHLGMDYALSRDESAVYFNVGSGF
ncbi:outer membrane protein [Vibrio ishigakensis]|uniref:Outer membrane protein n=1 Tax=Vibrio ishigakensis TaxID=1481914 RepID=A0A0B8QCG8_9VIBR|nr:outer membrane protein [Vibrio ishigakensis]